MTKSKVYLLDSNVLVALATPEHSLNARAAAWFRKGYQFATCPITQGALFRFHLRAGVEATAESAKLLLESISSSRGTNSGQTTFLISTCQPEESSGIGRSRTPTSCCWRGNTAARWPLWTGRWLPFTQEPHSSRSPPWEENWRSARFRRFNSGRGRIGFPFDVFASRARTQRVASTLSDEREAVREQVAAAWQLHVSRIEEQLNAGWREQIERVFEERFAELAARLEQEVASELEQARRAATQEFHSALLRLGAARTEEEWAVALLDSTPAFARRAAVFAIGSGNLRAVCARGIEAAGLEIPMATAFARVISTREPEAAGQGHLFRSSRGTKWRRCCTPKGIRSTSTAWRRWRRWPALIGGPRRCPSGRPGVVAALREEQDLHLRAHRFARVRVAEMRLYKSQAVRSGRAQKNLYAALKDEIDPAREAFRRDFTSARQPCRTISIWS